MINISSYSQSCKEVIFNIFYKNCHLFSVLQMASQVGLLE